MGVAEERERLRRTVLAQRDGLSLHTRQELSRAIAGRLWALEELRKARSIHVSLSVGSEVSTDAVVVEARRRGVTVVVPITVETERRLLLSEWRDGVALVPGPFGIPEPHPDARVPADVASLDAVVVPGLAFDPSGNRLGWGAGYYDRLLHGLRPDVPIVALAFECQVVTAIPSLGHDVRMSMIVTDQRVIRPGGGQHRGAG